MLATKTVTLARRNSDIFDYAEHLGFGELHFKHDAETGLRAIVAIHSTKRGPALGGCRCISYESEGDAIIDVMRLAHGMTYKAAIAGLELGGGKSVLIKPKEIKDRKAYFKAFAKFVDDLGGRYITAMDSGSTSEDMDAIAEVTPYVAGTSADHKGAGDPSPFTATGVRHGIEAAVKFALNQDSLKDIRIAIQGLGHVGYDLAHQLHELGAKLIVCDTSEDNVRKAVEELQATRVNIDDIYGVDCDVFAPCALGAILNEETIPQLKAKIVAGSANNQLARRHHGDTLHQRGILYAPDYVINAGGLIAVSIQHTKLTPKQVDEKIESLYGILLDLFARAKEENKATNVIADIIAEEILAKS